MKSLGLELGQKAESALGEVVVTCPTVLLGSGLDEGEVTSKSVISGEGVEPVISRRGWHVGGLVMDWPSEVGRISSGFDG